MLHHFAVVWLVEESAQGQRHDGAHVVHLQQLFDTGVHDGVEFAEMAGQVLGSGFTDVANTQAVEEAWQGGLFGLFQRGQHVLGGLVGHTVKARQGHQAEFVQVWQGPHHLGFDQLVHQLFTQAFDVHGAALGEVQHGLFALGRAEQAAGAAVVHLGFLAHHGAAADGAGAGHTEVGHVRGTWLLNNANNLWNHIPCPANDGRVTHPHAFAPQLKQVVQRGVGDGHTAHKHGRKPRHGCQLAGAAYLHVDAGDSGDLFLRGVFVRHGPARLTRHKTQLPLQCQAVHLVDHTVDVKRQLVTQCADLLVVRYQLHSTLRTLHLRCDRKTP